VMRKCGKKTGRLVSPIVVAMGNCAE